MLISSDLWRSACSRLSARSTQLVVARGERRGHRVEAARRARRTRRAALVEPDAEVAGGDRRCRVDGPAERRARPTGASQIASAISSSGVKTSARGLRWSHGARDGSRRRSVRRRPAAAQRGGCRCSPGSSRSGSSPPSAPSSSGRRQARSGRSRSRIAVVVDVRLDPRSEGERGRLERPVLGGRLLELRCRRACHAASRSRQRAGTDCPCPARPPGMPSSRSSDVRPQVECRGTDRCRPCVVLVRAAAGWSSRRRTGPASRRSPPHRAR